MDLLFLTASIGSGHIKAAEALAGCMTQKNDGSRFKTVDALQYANSFIDRIVTFGYLKAVIKKPCIYGKIYELSGTGNGFYGFSSAVNRFLSFRLLKPIEEFSPSAIICTHPFPLQMATSLKSRKKIGIPVVAVLTDYVIHSFWLHSGIDAYVVANETMKRSMILKGIPGNIIHPFGIPVRDSFLKRKEKETALKDLGLEEKPTFLVMGGSLGLGDLREMTLSLLEYENDIQIIVVTGTNLILKRQLENLCSRYKKNTLILGFTDRISDLMDAADFLITKPGGMTISEAMAKGLPMLIISPIPGHEEENADYLERNGYGIRIQSRQELYHVIDRLLSCPLAAIHMKECIRHGFRGNAAKNTIKLLECLLSKEEQKITS